MTTAVLVDRDVLGRLLRRHRERLGVGEVPDVGWADRQVTGDPQDGTIVAAGADGDEARGGAARCRSQVHGAALLGHVRAGTTTAYLHLVDEELCEAVDRVYDADVPASPSVSCSPEVGAGGTSEAEGG
jgi:hypothetical protein